MTAFGLACFHTTGPGPPVTPRPGDLAGLPTLVVSAARAPIAPPPFGRALAAGIPGAVFHE